MHPIWEYNKNMLHCLLRYNALRSLHIYFENYRFFDSLFWTPEMNAYDLFASKGELVHRKARRQPRAGHKGTANELERSNNIIVYLLQI